MMTYSPCHEHSTIDHKVKSIHYMFIDDKRVTHTIGISTGSVHVALTDIVRSNAKWPVVGKCK